MYTINTMERHINRNSAVQHSDNGVVLMLFLTFFAVGLPQALLGASWPAIRTAIPTPLLWVSGIAVIICVATIVSALSVERILQYCSTRTISALALACSAVAALGFASARSYIALVLFAIPYGFGSGALLTTLNSYIAVHYAARYVNWFHALRAIGSTVGHAILGIVIAIGTGWRLGYGIVGVLLVIICISLCVTSSIWSHGVRQSSTQVQQAQRNPQGDLLHDVENADIHSFPITTVVVIMLVITLTASAIQQTTMLWASSYMVYANGMSVRFSGRYAALFFVGLSIGLLVCGGIANRVSSISLLYVSPCVLAIGVFIMLLPFVGQWKTIATPILLGLGCAPVSPAIIHITPSIVGKGKTTRVIGLVCACQYLGTLIPPAVFGFLAQRTMHTLPWYLLVFTLILVLSVGFFHACLKLTSSQK